MRSHLFIYLFIYDDWYIFALIKKVYHRYKLYNPFFILINENNTDADPYQYSSSSR